MNKLTKILSSGTECAAKPKHGGCRERARKKHGAIAMEKRSEQKIMTETSHCTKDDVNIVFKTVPNESNDIIKMMVGTLNEFLIEAPIVGGW